MYGRRSQPLATPHAQVTGAQGVPKAPIKPKPGPGPGPGSEPKPEEQSNERRKLEF